MLCEKCKKNEATTYVKTVINGKVTEEHLCSECAAKNNIASAFDFSNPLSNILTSIFGDTSQIGAADSSKRCKCCGSDFGDIVNSGKLGCSECYETFFDELLPYLKRIHGGVKHIGKIAYTAEPAAQDSAESATVNQNGEQTEEKQEDTVTALKAQLKELIRQENFEQAAVVRDKIKALEEGEK